MKQKGCLWIAGGILILLLLIGIFVPEKQAATKKDTSALGKAIPASIGYWSNSSEEYAVDIDQQGTELYGSLYRIVKEKPVLITNKGKGTIHGKTVLLNVDVLQGNEMVRYKLNGIIAPDEKHLRSTLTITNGEGTQVKEMNLIKTDY